MSFNFYLFKGIRLLLLPFSLLAGFYIRLRNFFYDKGWYKSVSFNLPIICVGNLNVGGTGKSPMTEYLLALLSPKYKVGTLSRGYKRRTKGYILASNATTAIELGDEPMQFFNKFPQVAVSVGENRVEAIPQLLHDRPKTQVIILDDAFQHRQIKPGLSILLTDYANPYWDDWYLPTGDLRDDKNSAYRADIIIVTKCPPNLTADTRQYCLDEMKPARHQKVFFSCISYGIPYHIVTGLPFQLHNKLEVLLVCGIANPLPLKRYIEEVISAYFEQRYDDHHIFTIDDWKDISKKFTEMEATNKIILTTEKDAVRLLKFRELFADTPLFVMPIQHHFLFEETPAFHREISSFIENFSNTISN